MSCGFLDKYIDRLYTEEIGFLDKKRVMRHIESCPECREIYERITKGSRLIRESVLDVDAPSSLMLNVSHIISDEKHLQKSSAGFRKYVAAAIILVMIISASIYYILKINGSSGLQVPPGTAPSAAEQNNTNDPGIEANTGSGLEGVLEDYIKQKEGYTSKGGQVFVAMDIFGVEENNGSVKVYLWALIQEYAWIQGLTQGSGSSLPVVVELEKSGDQYTPLSFKIPRDGTYYGEDLKKMFPEKYLDKVYARQGKVKDLEQRNTQEAMEYFKNYTSPQNGASIETMIENFLDKYGWHAGGSRYLQQVKIPLNFRDEPGEIPVGLYWAYNNVLSSHIGYDLDRYKGMDATAHIIPIREEFGDGPNKNVRAIIIEVSGSIAGAWLDRGRSGFLTSLDRQYFGDITGKSWGQWLKDMGLVDYSSDGYEGRLASLSPEDIINKYYNAIARKDYKTAFSLQSKASQMGYLYINMDDSKLYNDDTESYYGGFRNITSVKVLNISPCEFEYNIAPDSKFNRIASSSKEYMAETYMTFEQEMVRTNGNNPWFIGMVKESSDAPWLINGIGTGP